MNTYLCTIRYVTIEALDAAEAKQLLDNACGALDNQPGIQTVDSATVDMVEIEGNWEKIS